MIDRRASASPGCLIPLFEHKSDGVAGSFIVGAPKRKPSLLTTRVVVPRSQPNWVRHPNPSLPIGAKSAPCLVFMARDHPLQSARPVPYEVVRQKMMRAMSTKVVPSHRTSQVPGGISDILASPQPHRDHLLQFLLGPDACPKFLHRAALKTENLSSDRQFLNSNTACNPLLSS